MTRKDYKLITSVMQLTRPGTPAFANCMRGYQWDQMLDVFVEELAQDNNKFDERMFRKACYEEG